jgi:hypothetical protein
VFSNFASTGTMLLVQQAALDMIFSVGGSGTENEVGRFSSSALGTFSLGVAGTNVGCVKLFNATSGFVQACPTTGALGSITHTWAAVSGTIYPNPMTTAGDIVIGSASGVPTRLAAGATSGHVLTSNGSGVAPSWQAASGGGGGSDVAAVTVAGGL